MQDGDAGTFVVGDIHGHRDGLLAALRAEGIVDEGEHWDAGTSRLWFLGDFLDRGPDGVGVVDDVMRLADEAEEAGGSVRALLGNHEVLALGVHRFGGEELQAGLGPRSFERSWRLNGGVDADQERLTEEHVRWLCELPALAVVDDHLLMHSDTIEYLSWGDSIDEINRQVHDLLAGEDIEAWWECWRRLTTRSAFRGPRGAQIARGLLDLLGGERIVHGHSVIAEYLGLAPAEIDGPDLYAGARVLGIDAGLFAGGPCLIVRLPYEQPE
ncbi:metallophosphoesterase [Sciscionella marina]|uniref:metallophosphoesterase n=1 Tax=Sciscionella marina TaxID=508770 RepID=UPI0003813B27|nr:metallophosphoesterase [Sciscionella marina]